VAVYEQTYRRYAGPRTSRRLRFLVIPRYAYQRLAGSKLVWALVVAAALATLGTATLIYLKHNVRALAALNLEVGGLLPIDARFFDVYLGIELFIGFLLVLIAGPPLISMDLANGALPLYLGRPLGRWEYLLGKLTVLAALLSVVTWVFALGLWLLQAVLEGGAWGASNLRIAGAIFAGSWIWILVLSFLTLALSALIRWPLAVRGVLLIVFLVLPGFGLALAQVIQSSWGHALNLGADLAVVQAALFGTEPPAGPPLAGAALVLAAVLAGSIGLLAAKLRAYEVVK
jgi:ABC-2 type transport system permease protein